ncbi:MAG: prepilin-type N-terminal cleavage/methylation domain-containing protein [Marinospirillum sp.]|nr:prepilin-type N-terminal cleavage/methylation domain-containing protein [Marinospirillum sp.]
MQTTKIVHAKAKSQGGFSLIELLVVVALLGVLLAVVVPNLTGGGADNVKAQGLKRIIDNGAANWLLLTQQTGTQRVTATNQLLASVHGGSNDVRALVLLRYADDPARAGITNAALQRQILSVGIPQISMLDMQGTGAAARVMYEGHELRFSVVGRDVTLQVQGVENPLLEALDRTFNPTTFQNSNYGAAGSNGDVSWTTASGGVRTVTLHARI